MTALEALLRTVADVLNGADRSWCLVGGLAVAVRCEPRFTRDIDVVVAVDDDADAEGVVAAFGQEGLRSVETLEHDGTGRLAAARLAREDEVVLDLLFASSGIEAEVAAAADVLEVLPGVHAPVASSGHLVALKLLSVDDDRPFDDADLRALLAADSGDAVAVARSSVATISQRGFHRGRDLIGLLERYL